MPILTPALIDLKSLIEQRANITFQSRPSNHHRLGSKEYHGSCPWCGGHDRFVLFQDTNWYHCIRGCGKKGDAIQFLRDYCDLSYHQACRELDIDPRYPEEARPPALPLSLLKDEPPCPTWQEAGKDFIQRAERYLWSPKATGALSYLHSRGFTDATIKQAHLGYCPGKFIDSLENWGLSSDQTAKKHITIPEGIIIPWFSQQNLWKIAVKRLEVQPGERTYGQVVGSSDGLYNVDSLRSNAPTMLVEGEFDALSIIQEANDLITCVATGGASKGQSARWIACLIQASTCLISFDNDDNKAGDNGADDWLSILPQSMRWLPLAHDVNDMLKTGMDIRLWAEIGIFTSDLIQQYPPTPPAVGGTEKITNKTSNFLSSPSKDLPTTQQKTDTRPSFNCRFCNVRRWTWYAEDKEYICLQCYSPAAWTEKYIAME